ncbi:MAG: hypothetical protein QF471_06495, partial [Phycisphaerales bacterium]|nr:hypothetical protein [Phycisphaerales bacterium]
MQRIEMMVMCVAVCAMCTLASAGDSCLVWDDFEDGTPEGIWTYSASSGSAVSASESGGHIGFGSSGTTGWDEDGAFGWSTGWALDMSQNWAISADWVAQPPLPTSPGGDVGLSIAVMLDGDPEMVHYGYGVTVTVGRWWEDGEGGDYEAFLLWNNNDWKELDEDVRNDNSGTLYVWYDAVSDTLYANDGLYDMVDPHEATSFLAGFPSATEAIVGFGAHSAGSVVSFGSSAMYGDHWCVLAGTVVGEAVGVCCMGAECVQTIEQSCDGAWLGVQADCGGCAAESCYGDVDGSGDVSVGDISALMDYWDDAGGSGDIDGNGVVDVHDLLDLLYH